MADVSQHTSDALTTEEGFLADRQTFWNSVTRYMVFVIVGLVGLLLFLWWWLV
jgi:hypothetical protein